MVGVSFATTARRARQSSPSLLDSLDGVFFDLHERPRRTQRSQFSFRFRRTCRLKSIEAEFDFLDSELAHSQRILLGLPLLLRGLFVVREGLSAPFNQLLILRVGLVWRIIAHDMPI